MQYFLPQGINREIVRRTYKDFYFLAELDWDRSEENADAQGEEVDMSGFPAYWMFRFNPRQLSWSQTTDGKDWEPLDVPSYLEFGIKEYVAKKHDIFLTGGFSRMHLHNFVGIADEVEWNFTDGKDVYRIIRSDEIDKFDSLRSYEWIKVAQLPELAITSIDFIYPRLYISHIVDDKSKIPAMYGYPPIQPKLFIYDLVTGHSSDVDINWYLKSPVKLKDYTIYSVNDPNGSPTVLFDPYDLSLREVSVPGELLIPVENELYVGNFYETKEGFVRIDPLTRKVTNLASKPRGLDNAVSVVDRDQIWTFDGRFTSCYSISKNTWKEYNIGFINFGRVENNSRRGHAV